MTFIQDCSGATAIEYGLIAAALAGVVIAAMSMLSAPLTALYGSIHFPGQ